MKVLISGSGIAGPTLSHFLSLLPTFHTTILDKGPHLLPHGQNVDLKGSAWTVVRKMGLLDQVRAAATKELGTRFVGTSGRTVAEFAVTKGCSESLSEFEIFRGDLTKLLHRRSSRATNVEYRFGRTITSVLENNATGIKVRYDDDSSEEFDMLVLADGQWSSLRPQIFSGEGEVRVLEQGMYAVYFTVPRLQTDDEWWNIHLSLKSRTVSTRPDPHGTMRALFTIMPLTPTSHAAWRTAARASRNDQLEVLRREFADAGWETQRLLPAASHAPDFYFQDITQIKMRSWSKRRVVCLGDTAYAPIPVDGNGNQFGYYKRVYPRRGTEQIA